MERVYATCAAEPPGGDASPVEVALALNAALATARADVSAAALARAAGEDRRVALSRAAIRLNERHLGGLAAAIEELLRAARDHPDDDGVWSTVLWAAIDRQDRRAAPPAPPCCDGQRRT